MNNIKVENIIGWAVLALGLIALIMYIRKMIPAKIDPDDLPNSGSGIPQGWTSSNLADRLHKMIDGVNFFLRENGALLREYAQVPTDDMFVAVSLDYNQRYKANLFDDINDELAVGLREDAERWKNAVLDRAKQLNLW